MPRDYYASDEIRKYWKSLIGAEPTPAEFNIFARVIPYLGGDNPLTPLFVHMIHLTHKDVGVIETEILEKGPSALQQAREMIAEFNETIKLLHRIRLEVERLTLIHDQLTQTIKTHEQRLQQRQEARSRQLFNGRHPAVLIVSASVGMLFASFTGVLLAAYVLSDQVVASSDEPAVDRQAPIIQPPQQNYRHSEDDWTPTERSH